MNAAEPTTRSSLHAARCLTFVHFVYVTHDFKSKQVISLGSRNRRSMDPKMFHGTEIEAATPALIFGGTVRLAPDRVAIMKERFVQDGDQKVKQTQNVKAKLQFVLLPVRFYVSADTLSRFSN